MRSAGTLKGMCHPTVPQFKGTCLATSVLVEALMGDIKAAGWIAGTDDARGSVPLIFLIFWPRV